MGFIYRMFVSNAHFLFVKVYYTVIQTNTYMHTYVQNIHYIKLYKANVSPPVSGESP